MVKASLGNLVRGMVDLVCPSHCALCHQPFPAHTLANATLCAPCEQSLGTGYDTACRRCGFPLPAALGVRDDCHRCRRQRLAFQSVHCLGLYSEALQEAVVAAKSNDIMALTLGRMLTERQAPSLAELEVNSIVPIPSHWRRRLSRGMNAADVVARCIGRHLSCRVQRVLGCRRATAKQGLLLPAARRTNVRDAFRIARSCQLTGKRILLVDDVLTTGATCHEAARTLRRAGASEVHVAVIARGAGRRSARSV